MFYFCRTKNRVEQRFSNISTQSFVKKDADRADIWPENNEIFDYCVKFSSLSGETQLESLALRLSLLRKDDKKRTKEQNVNVKTS